MTTPIIAGIPLSKDWWIGRILTQYYAEYTWVSLGFDDGTIIVASVEEVCVGKWFEVFPLKIDIVMPDHLSGHTFKWTPLPAPLTVCRARSLWRAEWLEPAQDIGQFLGSGPHSVQHVSRLQRVPLGANAFEVEAGIELQGIDGRCFVICSSDNSPFKIDLATETGEIEQILQFHTVQ